MTARQEEPFDPRVVAPYWLGRGDRGALLLHGFSGTPPELRLLGERLAAAGFLVHAPLLIGHGSTPEALARTTYRDWIASAAAALDALLRLCPTVAVAGQSAGGTLALHLAATRREIRAVVTQAAVLWLTDRRVRLLPAVHRVVRWHVPGDDVDLYEREAIQRLHSYRRRPTTAILELARLARLVRRELPQVVQPTLVLHGGRDSVVAPANADEIVGRIGSAVRALHRFERSGHGLSVDVDREQVADLGVAWLDRHTPRPAPRPGGAGSPAAGAPA
ncbi:MAG TPA: alpha/beta fold hydrolase [Candidatus Micrarchaeia archaeon]|nr:alpha/beta fold hydrolase [Candidatus Micrarchaeia archaeon]